MSPEVIDWHGGLVTFWDLHGLDPRKPLASQPRFRKEDLAQVEYPCDCVVDFGAYGEPPTWRVLVIVDEDWDSPVFSEVVCDGRELQNILQRAVAVAAGHGSRDGA